MQEILTGIGFDETTVTKYLKILQQECIDVDVLPLIESPDILKNIGIPTGHALRILHDLKQTALMKDIFPGYRSRTEAVEYLKSQLAGLDFNVAIEFIDADMPDVKKEVARLTAELQKAEAALQVAQQQKELFQLLSPQVQEVLNDPNPSLTRLHSVWSPIRKYVRPEVEVLLCGLSGAGKTTVLYQLRLGELIPTVPSVTFNMEVIQHHNTNYQLWDVQSSQLEKFCDKRLSAVMFVVDSADVELIQKAADRLHSLLSVKKLRDVAVMVIANKQDLPTALPTKEISERMQLNRIDQSWEIQPACSLSRDGLWEAMGWLHNQQVACAWKLEVKQCTA